MAGQRESILQQHCVRWFDSQYPQYTVVVPVIKTVKGVRKHGCNKVSLLFSIPNEGARSEINGARMNAMGRRKGVADMLLAIGGEVPNTPFYANGLFIEFKDPTGKGRHDKEQKIFQKLVEAQGYVYFLCESVEAFAKRVKQHLTPSK